MTSLIVSVNGKQTYQMSVGSFGIVTANVNCIETSKLLCNKALEASVDLTGLQLDLRQGRRHCIKAPIRLRVGDVVTIRAVESTDVSPGKWSKWEPHDFEENEKNRVRSQCSALGWEIDEGS